MTFGLALLACPLCRSGLNEDLTCQGCGHIFSASHGIPQLRVAGDARTEIVRIFYDAAPFPGYPPRDNISWLRARAERSRFAQLLDAAIPGQAVIAEIGCGTGQMSLYLARANRFVIGLDLSRNALELAAAAGERFGVTQVQFIESDLTCAGLKPGAFDVVYCSGVLHHTPDPAAAFAHVAPLAKPGGMIVLGLYNKWARLPLRLRRVVARLTNFRWIPCDPVLRDRAGEPERREAWIRDQYRHPEEHRHSVREVRRWFDDNDVEYLRAYPSTLMGDEPDSLFTPAGDEWPFESWLTQVGWMRSLGREGGLFVMIGRRALEDRGFGES